MKSDNDAWQTSKNVDSREDFQVNLQRCRGTGAGNGVCRWLFTSSSNVTQDQTVTSTSQMSKPKVRAVQGAQTGVYKPEAIKVF